MAKALWYKITKNQVVRFLLSASAGFAVDMSVFYVLFHFVFTDASYQILGVMVRNSTLSFSISYCLGVIVNFTMTRLLVFNQSKLPASKQFIRFLSVAILGYFANLGVLKIMIQSLHIYPPVARICAALSLFVASYFVHKFFSFSLSLRQHHNHEAQPDHHTGN